MKRTTAIFALALAAALTLPLFAGCSGGKTEPAQTTAAVEQTTETAAPPETEYEPPVKDLGGKDFAIYAWTLSDIGSEEETGESLNDAIFHRNLEIQDNYNCKFKFTITPGQSSGGTYPTWYSTLTGTIMAGDDAFQLVGGYCYRLAMNTMEGSFQNLSALPQLDFSQPWWAQEFQSEGNLGGALYVVTGYADNSFYDKTYAIFFNKDLAADLKLPDLYELVNEGKWTLAKLKEFTLMGAKDLNGDGKYEEAVDQFGASFNHNMATDAFLVAFDVRTCGHDKDGMPYLLGLTDHYVEVQEAMIDYMLKTDATNYTKTSDSPEFMEGRALFEGALFQRARQYREMDSDFGIIPYPKWNEAQDAYHTYNACHNISGWCIPVTANGEESASILEALDFYGWRDVMPVYFEKTLKGKTVRDSESAAMLDLIFSTISYDFTQIYSYNFGDQRAPTMLLRMTLKNGGAALASAWAKDEEMYNTTMAKLVETLKANK